MIRRESQLISVNSVWVYTAAERRFRRDVLEHAIEFRVTNISGSTIAIIGETPRHTSSHHFNKSNFLSEMTLKPSRTESIRIQFETLTRTLVKAGFQNDIHEMLVELEI